MAQLEFVPAENGTKIELISPLFWSVKVLLLHVLGIPLFWLGFVQLYRPEWMLRLLNLPIGDNTGQHITFHILMIMCIMIALLCATRIPLTAVRKHIRFNALQYILFCIGELALISLFSALYLTLILNGAHGRVDTPYFPMLARTLAMMVAVIAYPYIIFNLSVWGIAGKQETLQAYTNPNHDSLIRFVDSTAQLKLVVAASALLYVEASINYVLIRYIEGERLKSYQLRNTMKALEPLLTKNGIIRCQRSYFINPHHVTALRKDKDGIIVAELDQPDVPTIPVSPKYYDDLSKML